MLEPTLGNFLDGHRSNAPARPDLLTFTRWRSIGFIMLPWKNSTVVKCRLNSPSNSKSGGFLCGSKVDENVTNRWRHRRANWRRAQGYGRTQWRKQAGGAAHTAIKGQRPGQGTHASCHQNRPWFYPADSPLKASKCFCLYVWFMVIQREIEQKIAFSYPTPSISMKIGTLTEYLWQRHAHAFLDPSDHWGQI